MWKFKLDRLRVSFRWSLAGIDSRAREYNRSLPIGFVVHTAKVDVVAEHSHRHHRKCEDVRAGFQVASEGMIRRREDDVRVQRAIDHRARHADNVGGRCGVPHISVFRRKSSVADCMHVIIPNRPERGKNNAVADLVLLHHVFESG